VLQLGKGLEKNNKALKLALNHWLEAVRCSLLLCTENPVEKGISPGILCSIIFSCYRF